MPASILQGDSPLWDLMKSYPRTWLLCCPIITISELLSLISSLRGSLSRFQFGLIRSNYFACFSWIFQCCPLQLYNRILISILFTVAKLLDIKSIGRQSYNWIIAWPTLFIYWQLLLLFINSQISVTIFLWSSRFIYTQPYQFLFKCLGGCDGKFSSQQ